MRNISKVLSTFFAMFFFLKKCNSISIKSMKLNLCMWKMYHYVLGIRGIIFNPCSSCTTDFLQCIMKINDDKLMSKKFQIPQGFQNPMRRINCMRRGGYMENNIVSLLLHGIARFILLLQQSSKYTENKNNISHALTAFVLRVTVT